MGVLCVYMMCFLYTNCVCVLDTWQYEDFICSNDKSSAPWALINAAVVCQRFGGFFFIGLGQRFFISPPPPQHITGGETNSTPLYRHKYILSF
jgi:hypothetical protein